MSIDMDSNILNMELGDGLRVGLYARTNHNNAFETLSTRDWTIYYYNEEGEELGSEEIHFGDRTAMGVALEVREMYEQNKLTIPGTKEANAAEMGFNFLNERLPDGWRDRNWDNLDISDGTTCVLAILFMDYRYGSKILERLHGLSQFDHVEYGFDTGGMDAHRLNEEWLKLLQ